MDIRSLTQKAKEVCKRTSDKTVKTAKSVFSLASKHRLPTAIIAGVCVMAMLMSMALIIRRDVEIYVDGELASSFTTLESGTEKWLSQADIEVFEGDKVETVKNTVRIERAFYVTVTADGVDTTFKTTACTVEQALKTAKVEISDTDEVSKSLTELVSADDKITVYRKTSKTVTKTKEIDYETIEKKTSKLYVGEKEVETKGEKGEKKLVYEIVYTDGEETDRKLVSEEIVKEPVDKVVLVGTKEVPKVQTSSTPSSYKKVYTMRATAYTYGDDGGNITATGIRPHRGVVAVDPNVIPLGTKLYIESSDGSYVYGTAVAADTGGAIKGNKIDLFLTSESEVRSFGRRTVNVYVIG
ncbi:MAG: G5 domain-containing protein [Clostridia bacterium]|nr:G5 domain-containing protein [Clostridia bacterium]